MNKTIFFTTTLPNSGMGVYFDSVSKRFSDTEQKINLVQFVYRKNKKLFKNVKPYYGFTFMDNTWLVNDILGMPTKAIMNSVSKDVKLIHFSDPFSLPSLSAIDSLKRRGIKLICTVHDMIDQAIGTYNYHVDESFFVSFVRKLYGKDPAARSQKNLQKLSEMDGIITISNYTKRDLEMFFGMKGYAFSPDNILPIHYGIDRDIHKKMNKTKKSLRDKWNLPQNKKIIVNVSSEEPRKNLRTVYKALNLLGKDYVLLRVGSISSSNKKLIRKLRLSNRVLVRKDLDNEAIAELYNAGDVFVFPTCYEGFGLPPLEAMSCGLPTICSDWTSMKEVVGTGAVVPKDIFDEREIAQLIISVCENPGYQEQLSKKAIENSARFNWNKNMKQLLLFYKKVLK